MATIVSSTITHRNTQLDGRISVRELHIDSLNNNYVFDYMADQNTDQNSHLATSAANIIPQVAILEIASNMASVATFGSLAAPQFNFSTVAANVAALRIIYAGASQAQAIMIGDFLNSLSNAQLQSAFGLTGQQVTNLRANTLSPAAVQATQIRSAVGS